MLTFRRPAEYIQNEATAWRNGVQMFIALTILVGATVIGVGLRLLSWLLKGVSWLILSMVKVAFVAVCVLLVFYVIRSLLP